MSMITTTAVIIITIILIIIVIIIITGMESKTLGFQAQLPNYSIIFTEPTYLHLDSSLPYKKGSIQKKLL